jgi:hypothetical protein
MCERGRLLESLGLEGKVFMMKISKESLNSMFERDELKKLWFKDRRDNLLK